MGVRTACAAAAVALLALASPAGAQSDEVPAAEPPAADVPAQEHAPGQVPPPVAGQQPAADAQQPAAVGGSPNVLGRRRMPSSPTPPQREDPGATVSIVTPQQSRVHKRSRGTRTQDGDGVGSGSALDGTTGPNVQQLE
jgi:hypothetical protein